jgi:hypothetical protein
MDTWHSIEQLDRTEAARIGENGFGRRRKLSSAIIDLRKRSEKKEYTNLTSNCFHHLIAFIIHPLQNALLRHRFRKWDNILTGSGIQN